MDETPIFLFHNKMYIYDFKGEKKIKIKDND